MDPEVLPAANDRDPVGEFETRALQVYELAATFGTKTADGRYVIETDAQYEAAIELCKRLKRMREGWEQLQGKVKRSTRQAYMDACEVFNKLDTPLENGYEDLRQRCETFLEHRRIQQRQQLAASRTLETPAPVPPTPPPSTDPRLVQEFDAAVERGDTAKAERILRDATGPAIAVPPAPAVPAPAPPPQTIPKVEGTRVADNWTWDLMNEDEVPREYLMLDRKKITRVVKAMKDKTRIPGIQVRPDASLHIRT